VTIARALVNEPAIVWADEPTGDLDSRNADEIMDLIEGLNARNQQTFVIVTHDIKVAERTFRIVNMLDGEIVPWCDGCVMPFAHIQKRLGRKKITAAIIRENPAAFIAFDILYRDGRLLMDEPLQERRRMLEELSPPLLLTSLCSVAKADERSVLAARERRVDAASANEVRRTSP